VAATHVWWIIMENHEYGSIVGNTAAPYLNSLARTYGLATAYYATTHPSEPNYVALAAAGRSWRAYQQDYPGGCFTGSSASGGVDGPGAAGTYVRKHDPAIIFTSVSGNAAQCRNIQPLRDFDPAAGAFELISPNLTNDMHDGTVAQGDAFLKAFVPLITRSAAFRAGGLLFITFDEGSSSLGSSGDHGGRVATFIIRYGMRPGFRATGYADHYSLLRTTERLLGLPCLAGVCDRAVIPLG
jgi:acid phosphatase